MGWVRRSFSSWSRLILHILFPVGLIGSFCFLAGKCLHLAVLATVGLVLGIAGLGPALIFFVVAIMVGSVIS